MSKSDNRNKEIIVKALNNINYLEEYLTREIRIRKYSVNMSERELGIIMRRYSFLSLKRGRYLYCLYSYYDSYFEIYINKLDDDYYIINVMINICNKVRKVTSKDFDSDFYNNYYKVDQISGLLKFLNILFSDLKYLESYLGYKK